MYILAYLKALGKTIVKRLHFNPNLFGLGTLGTSLLQNTIDNILLDASGGLLLWSKAVAVSMCPGLKMKLR